MLNLILALVDIDNTVLNRDKLNNYEKRVDMQMQWMVLLTFLNLISYAFLHNFKKPEFIQENEAAYGAEELGWREALSTSATLSGWLFIETINGYKSMILGIISRRLLLLSKILDEESSGRKGFELTCFLEKRLAIYWDFNCSPFPTNVNPEDIAKTIIAFVKEIKTNWAAVDIYAYGHSSEEQQQKLRSSLAKQNVTLHHMGVTLIHTPRGRKDTMFFALLVDMLKRSHSFPEPSPIMLISANISYANALHALGLLGHKIILVTSSEVDVPVPLINASVYTWSDVAKETSSSQVQIQELPDANNNWPGSNLVKREDLVATSSLQFEELSMRCKEFVSIDPSAYLFIFWDLENCPIPKEVPTKDVALNIRTFVTGKIDCSSQIRAYGDFSRIHGEARESLEKSGVKLINTPHVKKDAADEAMMIDLYMYSKLVPSPSSIMVITGDVDFATTLHALAFRHDIFLAIPSGVGVSRSLINASKYWWYWSDVVTGPKAQLVNLLKSNGGQLPFGSLVAEYQKIFMKPLYLSEYKARKLENLLKKMSDVISVEDLNGETSVKLKGGVFPPRLSYVMAKT